VHAYLLSKLATTGVTAAANIRRCSRRLETSNGSARVPGLAVESVLVFDRRLGYI
jgi:hypothetical protein